MTVQPFIHSIRRACAVTMIVASAIAPTAASAHVFPQSQTPSAGADVSSPANVTITFNGPLEPAFSGLTISDASGKTVSREKATVAPNDARTIS
ncbi:MAG: copper resistance protein CopC, partial [Burkholderia sp.]|nr:copper resistance protein CopC [Burkholderia sp.]